MKKTPSSAKAEQLCPWFMSLGRVCSNGKDCIRPHITKLSDLPDQETQDLYCQKVAANPNYEFAPGHGPAAGNH